MKKTIIIITTILCVAALSGCHQTGRAYYQHELEKIDHRQNRELARKEAVAISDEIANQAEDLRMYHLLMIAEMNEEVLPYRNLETARRLTAYYETHGDKQKLIRAYIIAGIIYANCSDSPKALGLFHRAEDMLDDNKNPELRNKLYARIAKLQLRHNMPDAARLHAQKVLDYARTDTKDLKQAERTIEATSIWQRLATLPESEHPTDDDWQELSDAINHTYEEFSTKLMRLSHPTPHEIHVCLLLKAGFEPARIATLTLRSKAAISTARSRLYEKTFGKKGSAKDWDEVIRTI